jgi:hypothetical protein
VIDKAQWDAEGNPVNLAAAAEDAHKWLEMFADRPMSSFNSLKAARDELRKFLDEAQSDR